MQIKIQLDELRARLAATQPSNNGLYTITATDRTQIISILDKLIGFVKQEGRIENE